MRTSTSSYIVELPLRVNDQQNRFLEKAFEFGRTLYNATLGTALGRLQRMRETQEWRVARDMPKGKARTKAFSAVHKAFGLTEFGLTIIANNHRKASGRKDIGAHEAQSIGKALHNVDGFGYLHRTNQLVNRNLSTNIYEAVVDGRNVYVIDKNITFIKENYLNQYYGKKDSVIVYKDEKEFNGFTIYSVNRVK